MFSCQGRLVGSDYALNLERPLTFQDAAILAALDQWSTVRTLASRLSNMTSAAIQSAVKRLHEHGFVETSDEPVNPRRTALASWGGWLPEAGFFHFSKRDLRRIGLEEAERTTALKAALWSPPPPVKAIKGATVGLDAYPKRGALPAVLLERRSWRRFANGGITKRQLSTLLGLTWGVQRWMHVAHGIRSALKTSPSSGATHSLEVYVIVQRIQGLRRGIYRYCADRHVLERVRTPIAGDAVAEYLQQPWFADCAAAFVTTAVWPRVQFKYRSPRTYASVLIETGHFAQTFCLLATWLGLAPFCTGAFAESVVERALRIDGVNESALYVTGVGRRPPGVVWAPWPDPAETPRTSKPASSRAATSGRRT